MKNILVVLISILLILFFNFCAESEKTNNIEEIFFSVDSSKLGEKINVSNLNISINPPKKWELMNYDSTLVILNSVKSQLENKVLLLELQRLFIDSTTNSIMILSKLLDKSHVGKKQFIELYTQQIKKIEEGSQLMINDFIKGEFDVTQFLIRNKNYINFKLVAFNKKNILQLDFYVPPKEYNIEIAKAIESSIGSLNLLNN